MKKNLLEKQEEMKRRLASPSPIVPKEIPGRPRCVACGLRYARLYSTICSRCNQEAVINIHRDVLPGMGVKKSEKEVPTDSSNQLHMRQMSDDISSAVEGDHGASVDTSDEDLLMCEIDERNAAEEVEDQPPLFPNVSSGPTFTRRQVATMLHIAPNTLGRWERKGKVPRPIKLAHNNQYVYTDAHIRAIKEFMSRTVEQSAVEPEPEQAKTLDQASRGSQRFKLSRSAEKTVATKLSSFSRGPLI